jgi:two-component system, OmpR family, phosphate regulon sensor histidine kinase PhoR
MPGWIGWAVVAVLAGIGGVLLLRCRVVIAAMEQRLDEMEAGRRVRPLRTDLFGPVGKLARRFNEVMPTVEGRIAGLERDVQQLRVVLGGMVEGVLAVDSRRRLLFANASADALFGLDSTSVGRFLPELIRSPQIQEAVEAALVGPGVYTGEATLASREPFPKPHARTLSVHGAPLPGAPPGGAVLVFHDVSDLRRLERMRRDFVANVSHELKTPLASIKAYTETLLDWALHDEEVNVRFLNRIDEQAERLNRLILDLLDLAKLDSGDGVFDHAPIALAPVIRNCVESTRDRATAKELTLALDDGTLDDATLVVADEEAVRQILDNLLDNAVKYTPEGGWVRVACMLSACQVTIEVADSGIGIPRDDLSRVFERFYRVDKARSRELGGTGLGLSIVKHLVQSIGGTISVASRVGEGTQFTIQLPVHRAVTTAAASAGS